MFSNPLKIHIEGISNIICTYLRPSSITARGNYDCNNECYEEDQYLHLSDTLILNVLPWEECPFFFHDPID